MRPSAGVVIFTVFVPSQDIVSHTLTVIRSARSLGTGSSLVGTLVVLLIGAPLSWSLAIWLSGGRGSAIASSAMVAVWRRLSLGFRTPCWRARRPRVASGQKEVGQRLHLSGHRTRDGSLLRRGEGHAASPSGRWCCVLPRHCWAHREGAGGVEGVWQCESKVRSDWASMIGRSCHPLPDDPPADGHQRKRHSKRHRHEESRGHRRAFQPARFIEGLEQVLRQTG